MDDLKKEFIAQLKEMNKTKKDVFPFYEFNEDGRIDIKIDYMSVILFPDGTYKIVKGYLI